MEVVRHVKINIGIRVQVEVVKLLRGEVGRCIFCLAVQRKIDAQRGIGKGNEFALFADEVTVHITAVGIVVVGIERAVKGKLEFIQQGSAGAEGKHGQVHGIGGEVVGAADPKAFQQLYFFGSAARIAVGPHFHLQVVVQRKIDATAFAGRWTAVYGVLK